MTVDGRIARSAQRLRGGETITLTVPPPIAAEPLAQELPLRVLFEDRHLLVLDKAPGMVVHPGAGHADGTLVNALLHHVTDLGGVGGTLRPGIVHRLDKDTSGCLVVAKHERSLVALQSAFKSRDIDKRYLALVHGSAPESGRIETLFGRHPVHRQRFSGRVKEGKSALTEFLRHESFEGATLLEVLLHTGRTHQIRVHLSELGHPLLCDELYGARAKAKGAVAEAEAVLGRQALHAWKLSFAHPMSGKPLAFEAPLPADFSAAMDVLRAAPKLPVKPPPPKTRHSGRR